MRGGVSIDVESRAHECLTFRLDEWVANEEITVTTATTMLAASTKLSLMPSPIGFRTFIEDPSEIAMCMLEGRPHKDRRQHTQSSPLFW